MAIALSGTSSAAPCELCNEPIPERVPGLVLWFNHQQLAEDSALICFGCVDVMACIVAGARKSRAPRVEIDPPEVR